MNVIITSTTPDAFDFELMNETLRSLKAFKRTEVPQYDFSTHSRMKDWKTYYGANVILFEGLSKSCHSLKHKEFFIKIILN